MLLFYLELFIKIELLKIVKIDNLQIAKGHGIQNVGCSHNNFLHCYVPKIFYGTFLIYATMYITTYLMFYLVSFQFALFLLLKLFLFFHTLNHGKSLYIGNFLC